MNPRSATPPPTPAPAPAFQTPTPPPEEPKRNGAIAAGIVLSLLVIAAAVFYFNPFGSENPTAKGTSVPSIEEENAGSKADSKGTREANSNDAPAADDGSKASDAKANEGNAASEAETKAATATPTGDDRNAEPKATTAPKRRTPPKRVVRSRRRRPPVKAQPKENVSATTETPEETGATTADLGLMDADQATGAARRSKTNESVSVDGVELMSPSAVDRAKAPTKKKSDQVKAGDVILADDYE